MNALEPWLLLRLVASLAACLLFVRGARTAVAVLRHFDGSARAAATEAQLALETQIELGATFVRVGSVVQVGAFVVAVLGADRMSRAVRGAMCAYGVFGANEWGFRSLVASGFVALFASVVTQVYAFDDRVRVLDLAKPLAYLTLAMVPFSLLDLALEFAFVRKLDLSVVASCCSVQLDAVASEAEQVSFFSNPHAVRQMATFAGFFGAVAAIVASAWVATRSAWSRGLCFLAGAVTLVALPCALLASVLEVAPHAFEVPQHGCPFCLLKSDVMSLGYALYGALFLAATFGLGASVCAVVARTAATREALPAFARTAFRRAAFAWGIALFLGIAPVARFAWVTGGATLFHD